MILDFFEGKLDGDTWEELCQSCYRIKYQEQHYTEIPAVQEGDAGIEGFTRNGIVNPELFMMIHLTTAKAA